MLELNFALLPILFFAFIITVGTLVVANTSPLVWQRERMWMSVIILLIPIFGAAGFWVMYTIRKFRSKTQNRNR